MRRPLSFIHFYILLLSVAGIAGIFLIKGLDGTRSETRDGVAMDTVIRMTVYAVKPRGEIGAMLDGAFALVGDLEKKFSMYETDSDVSAVNRSAGVSPASAGDDVRAALLTALRMAELTDGAYDPTIGAVTNAWRDGEGNVRLPSSGDLAHAVGFVNYRRLRLTDGEAYLEDSGAMLDLGGIAKGYASRAVSDLLRSGGASSAIADLGGNVIVIGDRPDGRPWRIGVQDPFKARGNPLCIVDVSNTSIVTSGVYERRWEIDGREFSHIYDPSTGLPVSGDLLSVTLISDDPTEGDALSTAFMVMGRPMALEILRVIPGVEAIFVSESEMFGREVVATRGLSGAIEMVGSDYRLSFVDVY
ncbi:MAG: FAD:protein FMN transferase [Synergistaceae bacterium]|jgi:thiamine biosynthesis lipoprotein|nr:FAD:protein FMN transferase [Synergistaceae bacterium]